MAEASDTTCQGMNDDDFEVPSHLAQKKGQEPAGEPAGEPWEDPLIPDVEVVRIWRECIVQAHHGLLSLSVRQSAQDIRAHFQHIDALTGNESMMEVIEVIWRKFPPPPVAGEICAAAATLFITKMRTRGIR